MVGTDVNVAPSIVSNGHNLQRNFNDRDLRSLHEDRYRGSRYYKAIQT